MEPSPKEVMLPKMEDSHFWKHHFLTDYFRTMVLFFYNPNRKPGYFTEQHKDSTQKIATVAV